MGAFCEMDENKGGYVLFDEFSEWAILHKLSMAEAGELDEDEEILADLRFCVD